MEEGDLLVLRVTIGVSFAFLPLLIKSNQGSFSFFYCFCSFNSCVIVLFLSNVLQTVRIGRFETA